jgi:hypothetical protein
MDAYTAAREYGKSAVLELLTALEARPRAWLGTGNRRLYRRDT